MARRGFYRKIRNIGFVLYPPGGVPTGSSLETAKWANVFQSEGFNCLFMAGELDSPETISMLVPEAHFTHPRITGPSTAMFNDNQKRDRKITAEIHRLAPSSQRPAIRVLPRISISNSSSLRTH